MTKQYITTVYSPAIGMPNYYITTEERPYWDTDPRGINIYIGDMVSVGFVRDGCYSAVITEEEDVDDEVAEEAGTTGSV